MRPAPPEAGALPTHGGTGRGSRIAPQAQQKEGATLFDVEIELDRTAKVVLRAGYSANADLIIREKKDVVTIPERVVIFEDGGQQAFVERPGATTKAVKRLAELSFSTGMKKTPSRTPVIEFK